MYFEYYLMGIIVVPAIIFSLYAQIKVQSSFNTYSQEYARSGVCANELLRRILDACGMYETQIIQIRGEALNNYYDPTKNIIALSSSVYASSSISALGVACHELGHAMQYKQNYAPIKIRNAIIPVCNVISNLVWPLIILGFMFNIFAYSNSPIGKFMIYCGVIFFGITVLINLLTLPCEFDASKRANRLLSETMTLDEVEAKKAKKVLDAAALTYVAALLVSLLNLLRFVLVVRRRD